MTAQVLHFSAEFQDIGNCYECGVRIFMPADMERNRRRDHQVFYCINGHGQHWSGKSDLEQLQAQLAEKERLLAVERERASTNYAAREKAERKLRKIERRTSAGVCPCCNRSFSALTRHMKTKHPEFVEEHRS